MTLRKKMGFYCPGCEKNVTKMEEILSYATVATSLEVLKDGELSYGARACIDGEVERYQCYSCGYILRNENGNPITEEEKVIEWLNKHKKKRRKVNATRRDEES